VKVITDAKQGPLAIGPSGCPSLWHCYPKRIYTFHKFVHALESYFSVWPGLEGVSSRGAPEFLYNFSPPSERHFVYVVI
jgi:hypothetical protein